VRECVESEHRDIGERQRQRQRACVCVCCARVLAERTPEDAVAGFGFVSLFMDISPSDGIGVV
jgi:hypothetical protein